MSTRNFVILALALIAGMWAVASRSAPFDSSEPICSTSDALFCDDFEDGSWWLTPEAPGGAGNDGWAGGVYFPSDPQGTHYGRCGGASRTGGGAGGTNCAATSMVMTDNMGAGANGRFETAPTSDFYVRYYWWVSPGFRYGHQKGLGFERDLGGHFDYGLFHHPFQSGELQFIAPIDDRWRKANQGKSSSMNQSGWYLFEAHIRLNTPGQRDGLLETWLDFCGSDATCSNVPDKVAQTLVMRHSDVNFRGSDSRPVRSFYWNNWSNYIGQPPPLTAPPSNGEMYYDQIVVAKTRIGPMLPPVSGPPPGPCDGDLNGDGIVAISDIAMAFIQPLKWDDVIRWFGQRCAR